MHHASVFSGDGVEKPYEEDKTVTDNHGVSNSGPLGDEGSFSAGKKSPSMSGGGGTVIYR